MKRLGVVLAIAVAFGLQAKAQEQGQTALTPKEMHQLAVRSIVLGNDALALELAEALLWRDPTDTDALLIKAQAARNLGQYQTAQAAGRAAWRGARTGDQRYSAALVTAQALASDEKRTRAQLWLRRAADVAPNEVARNRAVRDFRYVRQRNPWATELSFNVAPSNNINNGSIRDRTTLFGLPFEFELSGAAQALSGTEYSGGIATRYRFDESELRAQDLIFQLDHRGYVLSDAAKAKAPGVSGSDFAFTQASASYIFRSTPENWIGPYTLGVTAGQSWYGGDPYFGYLRLGATQSVAVGTKARLTMAGSAERQFGARAPDADILKGDVSLVRAVGQVGALRFSAGATGSDSAQDEAEFTELRTGIDFTLDKPVLGAQLRFGLEWRQRDYPRSRYDPLNGRDDTSVSASIDMVFTGIERYGFNPTLSIEGTRTDSNIGLFDSEQIGVRFGIRSAF